MVRLSWLLCGLLLGCRCDAQELARGISPQVALRKAFAVRHPSFVYVDAGWWAYETIVDWQVVWMAAEAERVRRWSCLLQAIADLGAQDGGERTARARVIAVARVALGVMDALEPELSDSDRDRAIAQEIENVRGGRAARSRFAGTDVVTQWPPIERAPTCCQSWQAEGRGLDRAWQANGYVETCWRSWAPADRDAWLALQRQVVASDREVHAAMQAVAGKLYGVAVEGACMGVVFGLDGLLRMRPPTEDLESFQAWRGRALSTLENADAGLLQQLAASGASLPFEPAPGGVSDAQQQRRADLCRYLAAGARSGMGYYVRVMGRPYELVVGDDLRVEVEPLGTFWSTLAKLYAGFDDVILTLGERAVTVSRPRWQRQMLRDLQVVAKAQLARDAVDAELRTRILAAWSRGGHRQPGSSDTWQLDGELLRRSECVVESVERSGEAFFRVGFGLEVSGDEGRTWARFPTSH